MPTARRLPGIAPPARPLARSLGRKCSQSQPRFLGGSGLSGSSEPAPSRGPSAPAGRAEPRDPEGGGRTCQPGRLPGEGLPSIPAPPGAWAQRRGRMPGGGGVGGVRVRARSGPRIRYEPVIQPGRPTEAESSAFILRVTRSPGAGSARSVGAALCPIGQVIRSHYMGQCLALRVSAFCRKVLFC